MLKLSFVIVMLATLHVLLLPVFGLPTGPAGNPTTAKLEKRMNADWAGHAVQVQDLEGRLSNLSLRSDSTVSRADSDLSSHYSDVEILPTPGGQPGGFEKPLEDDYHYEGLRNYRGIDGYEDPYGQNPPPRIRMNTDQHQGTLAELPQSEEEHRFQAQLAERPRNLPAHVSLAGALDLYEPVQAPVQIVAMLLDLVARQPGKDKSKIELVFSVMPTYIVARQRLADNKEGLAKMTPNKIRTAVWTRQAAKVLRQEIRKESVEYSLGNTKVAVENLGVILDRLNEMLVSPTFQRHDHKHGARFGGRLASALQTYIGKASATLIKQERGLQTARSWIDLAMVPSGALELKQQRQVARDRIERLARHPGGLLFHTDPDRLVRMLRDYTDDELQQLLEAHKRLSQRVSYLGHSRGMDPDQIQRLEYEIEFSRLVDAFDGGGKPAVQDRLNRLNRQLLDEETSRPGWRRPRRFY